MLCDASEVPLRFLSSGGQASDISYIQPLPEGTSIALAPRGRPCKHCQWLLADKGYHAEVLRQYCDRARTQPVISMRSSTHKP